MAEQPPKKKPKVADAWKLPIPGNSEAKAALSGKLNKAREIIKSKMNRAVNYNDILNTVLDSYIEGGHVLSKKGDNANVCFTPYLEATCDGQDNLFVGTELSAHKLIEIVENHNRICPEELKQKKCVMKGHVAMITLGCDSKKHKYTWSSSPHMPNSKKFLVNYRMVHGIACSGILPVAYQRFCNAAGIGYMGETQREPLKKGHDEAIADVYEDSIEDALYEEISHVEDLEKGGISAMSDARHGWRKNAKDSSIVVIGEKSHKVLCHKLVTTADDPCTQRHETLGTKAVMDDFDEKGICVNMWIHDRNVSLNKEIKSRGIVSQNDLWHGIKNLKKVLKNISAGSKKSHGQTWHNQLDDKINGIANHVHHAARKSAGSAEALRNSMDSIVRHYKDDHSQCSADSRCKTDPDYDPSKKVITNSVAEQLLTKALHKSTIYVNAQDFAHGKDTHYVESFNNTMNIFQDKRISFTSKEYEKRAKLACLHWNENVDRKFTSTWQKPSAANRRSKTKKVYHKLTYMYTRSLWKKYLSKIV